MAGIGSLSSLWRRWLTTLLSSVYLRRRVRTVDGDFEAYVSPGSSLKVLRPSGLPLDKVHLRFIADWVRPDSVVWDIGGNLGLFALPAAVKARNGQVYVFEADVDLAANLLRSSRLRRNRALPFSVFCVAVSGAEGTATFQIARHGRAMNKLAAAAPWNDRQVESKELRAVVTVRLDTLAKSLRPPHVMKIDVEGAEMEVLHGAEETIARHRPVILIEGPDELADAMSSYFKKLDYVMLDGSSERAEPVARAVWDTIAIPREHFSAVQNFPNLEQR